jgi:hypothetical protein
MQAISRRENKMKSGFYWIRLESADGLNFEPLVAWLNDGKWHVPGSAQVVAPDVKVHVFEPMLSEPEGFAPNPAI